MKIFLDANILVAVLSHEYPTYTYASRLLSLSGQKRITIYTSAICLAIAYYFAEKKHGAASAKSRIAQIAKHIDITPCGKKEAVCAADNPAMNDYEDGLQYYAAKHAGCDYIVTEDSSDFYFSELPVMDAESFLFHYVGLKK